MEAAPVIRWFKTRRALLADIDRQRDLLTARDIEIRDLHHLLNETQEREGERITALQESLRHAQQAIEIGNEQVRRLTTERDDLRSQNIRVRTALQVLRDDIRREETPAFGMARAIPAPAPKRRTEPMPWQTRDAIAQDAMHKRLEDQ